MSCYDFPLLKDEVSLIVQDAVRTVLEGNVYDNIKANEWVNLVTNACIEDLKRLCPNFKYIVTCFIRQRNGAGLEVGSGTYWDEKSDGASRFLSLMAIVFLIDVRATGSWTVLWENATIATVLYVYGLAI